MSLKSKKHSKPVYRSGLEKKFAKLMPKGRFLYEPYDIPYVTHRKYKPDFVDKKTGDVIETKGFFRAGDTQKYTAIRDMIAPTKLVFVLSDPNKKVRKGSKLTMGQWCSKEGFDFYTLDEYVEHVTDNG
jgi:hypothetical protein